MELIRVMRLQLPSRHDLLPLLERLDNNRVYSNFGPLSEEFSDGLRRLTGISGVTLTCNGTAAIEVGLRARAIPGRTRCLMPSFTFVASAHAVVNAGLVPHLLDIDPISLTLTPEIVEGALAGLPEAPAAVLVVSAFGAPPDLEAWRAFEREYGIPVIYDAAAALTAMSPGLGSQIACVSLHATKVLGIGEGGALLTDDLAIASLTRSITGFGFSRDSRTSQVLGGNYRMSEYAAAVGIAALRRLPERQSALRSMIAAYRDRLTGRLTRLQDDVGIHWTTMTLNVIIPPDAVQETIDRLDRHLIEWRHWWGLGLHRHPAFARCSREDLSVTDVLAPRIIGIPFHLDLTPSELDRVVSCLP